MKPTIDVSPSILAKSLRSLRATSSVQSDVVGWQHPSGMIHFDGRTAKYLTPLITGCAGEGPGGDVNTDAPYGTLIVAPEGGIDERIGRPVLWAPTLTYLKQAQIEIDRPRSVDLITEGSGLIGFCLQRLDGLGIHARQGNGASPAPVNPATQHPERSPEEEAEIARVGIAFAAACSGDRMKAFSVLGRSEFRMPENTNVFPGFPQNEVVAMTEHSMETHPTMTQRDGNIAPNQFYLGECARTGANQDEVYYAQRIASPGGKRFNLIRATYAKSNSPDNGEARDDVIVAQVSSLSDVVAIAFAEMEKREPTKPSSSASHAEPIHSTRTAAVLRAMEDVEYSRGINDCSAGDPRTM